MDLHPFAVQPPAETIALAEHAAQRSPCMKSKRGAVVYQHVRSAVPTVLGIGFNGPPGAIACDGSESCRRDCGVRCVHAEIRSLMHVVPFQGTDLVHVKIGPTNTLVAGGPPSCVQCSKVIADLGIRGVWLYEQKGCGEWRFYTAENFHAQSLWNAQVY